MAKRPRFLFVPDRSSNFLRGLIWLALALILTVSGNVVEDIMFEAPHFLTGEQSIASLDDDDALPDVWILRASANGQVPLEPHDGSAARLDVLPPHPPHPGAPSYPFRQLAFVDPPSLSLPPLRI